MFALQKNATEKTPATETISINLRIVKESPHHDFTAARSDIVVA